MSPPRWDVVVIGAGPAGAMSALLFARSGCDVMLVERQPWPRTKVCGGCLNAAACGVLRRHGLGDPSTALNAPALDAVDLSIAQPENHAVVRRTIRLDGGLAIRRDRFDAWLVEHALKAGATFRAGQTARVTQLNEPGGHGHLVEIGGERVRASFVVAADGLSGSSLNALPASLGLAPRITRGGRMGVGALMDDAGAGHAVPANRIAMHVHPAGYAGVVRVPGGGADVAAALKPGYVARMGGPGPAVAAVFEACGADALAERLRLRGVRWGTTPALTRRRRRIAAPGLVVVGDAAGYVEPFTGEGIAWALRSAEALVLQHTTTGGAWPMERWPRVHARIVAVPHWRCRAVAQLVRRPRLAALAARVWPGAQPSAPHPVLPTEAPL